MKKRLRKKLKIKEFTIREFDLYVKFAAEMPDEFVDIFLDKLCDEVDKRAIYFGGCTFPDHGHYTLFLDDLKKQPQALEIMCDLVDSISQYMILSVELIEITNFTDNQLEELWEKNNAKISKPTF